MSRFELAGLLVSRATYEEAIRTWPRRPATGYDDRQWRAACANHVLLIARERGEDVQVAKLAED